MRILIVDDEPLARERLASLIREDNTGEVVGEAANGVEAINRMRECAAEVVLMDIRMPGMDGLEAARHLAALDPPPAVIFTTAYGDHALEAFDAHAIDYLLKPIRKERLLHALERAHVLTRAAAAEVDGQAEGPRARTHLSALVHGNVQLVPIEEVRYFLADQKYVAVTWPGGKLLIEESLKALEDEFADRFLRIHRNALVALAYVEALEKDSNGNCYVRLRDVEEPLVVSRRHLANVRSTLRNF